MPGPYRDRHPRIGRREPLQEPRQRVGPDPRRRPEHQPPARSPPQLLQMPPALLEAPDTALGVRQELLAGLREPHPPARPHEELIPDLLLQRLQPRRQRGLRQKHLLRRPAQVPQPRHRQETFHLPKKHASSLRSSACQHAPALRPPLVSTPRPLRPRFELVSLLPFGSFPAALCDTASQQKLCLALGSDEPRPPADQL